MQGFSFMGPPGPPREGQKSKTPIPVSLLCGVSHAHKSQNKDSMDLLMTAFTCLDYVFVDEHNRHKRLKGKQLHLTVSKPFAEFHYLVMRACNGCRKRKIKCDAATTNAWPCSACTRLKLVCVPPTIGQEGESSGRNSEAYGPHSVDTFNAPDPPQSLSSYAMPQPYRGGAPHGQAIPQYNDGIGAFSHYAPATIPTQPGLFHPRPPQETLSHDSYQSQQLFSVPQAQAVGTTERIDYGDNEHSTAENLSEVLGELKIDETGIG